MPMNPSRLPVGQFQRRSLGFSLLEVLVAIVIVAFGLLGLAGLQGRMINAEMETYQRSHALMLLQDMVERLRANRAGVADGDFAADIEVGTGDEDADCGASPGTDFDLCEWSRALRGAATTDGEAAVGAMIGARGCIEQLETTPPTFRVSVAWQGLQPTTAPNFTCGQDQYGDDTLRRVIAVEVVVPTLE